MKNIFNVNIQSFFSNRNKKSLFKAYILAVICIFLFTLVSFYFMYYNVRSNVNNNNELIINTASKSLNDVFKSIDDVYKTVENSMEGQTLFAQNSSETDAEVYSKFTAKISESMLMHTYLEEIVIISKEYDYVLTSQGNIRKKDFFEKNYSSEMYGMNFFDNLITDYLNVKMVPAASYKNLEKYPAEDPKSLFAFVKTYSENDINVIIFVSEDEFIKAANLSPLENNINFKIYDYNDTVVYSNNDSDYLINTMNVSKNFEKQVIDRGLKKYYVYKSDYNYFYYVAEVTNHIFMVTVIAIVILLIGLLVSLYYLAKRTVIISDKITPVFSELDIPENDGELDDIYEKVKLLKEEVKESASKVNTMSDEIKSSIFLKVTTSSSFYNRYRKTVDLVFDKIIDENKFIIFSVETVKENIKLSRYDTDAIISFLNKKGINYVHIEEKTRKNLFVVGFSNDSGNEIVSDMTEVFNDIRNNNIEIFVCYSKEFESLNNLYDAFRDIRICRDYRGIDDKTSILNTGNIAYGNHIHLPLNFKEELTGRLIAKEEDATKEYIKEIFVENIKNNIPLSKFEFMLRQMLNTVIDALSMNRKSNSDVYELEQVFLAGIENLKDNFDVYGIINSFINLVHLSINMYDNKKSVLNRTDVIKYINTNYAEDLYLEKIATEFGTTPKYFSNYFKKEFTVGFNEYLTNVRISHAKQILSETDLSLAEVSEKVGYSNQATFAVAFKKVVAIPPGKYREINKVK